MIAKIARYKNMIKMSPKGPGSYYLVINTGNFSTMDIVA
jgi:hypothetical protein